VSHVRNKDPPCNHLDTGVLRLPTFARNQEGEIQVKVNTAAPCKRLQGKTFFVYDSMLRILGSALLYGSLLVQVKMIPINVWFSKHRRCPGHLQLMDDISS